MTEKRETPTPAAKTAHTPQESREDGDTDGGAAQG